MASVRSQPNAGRCRRAFHAALRLCVAGFGVLLFSASVSQLQLAASEAVGSLFIESEPAGASVYVDGRLAGETPLTIETLAAGVHRVRLVRLGYLENSRLVTVKAGSRATLRTRLTSPRPQNAPGQAALKIVVLDGEGQSTSSSRRRRRPRSSKCATRTICRSPALRCDLASAAGGPRSAAPARCP